MRVLVTGTGRGGTTLTREVVIGFNISKFYCSSQSKEEDAEFFRRKDLPENYMTKLATPSPPPCDGFTIENLIKRMQEYDDLHLIFSFRHPVDTCMSKIVRGQGHFDGGDKAGKGISPDGTVEGAVLSVKLMYKIYEDISQLYPKRVLAVDFENLILNPRKEVEKIARFLNVKVTKRSLLFYRYNSNRHQFRRYGTDLDRSQVDVHKRWKTAYGGFFKDKEEEMDKLRKAFL